MSTANVRMKTVFELHALKGLDDLMRGGLAPLEGARLMDLVRDGLALFEAKPNGLLGEDGLLSCCKTCKLSRGLEFSDRSMAFFSFEWTSRARKLFMFDDEYKVRSERACGGGFSLLLMDRENTSDRKETLRLREGHKDSGNLLPIAFLAVSSIPTYASWTGVEEHDGDCGVQDRLLSTNTTLFEIGDDVVVIILVVFGEEQLLDVGDLYLELTSLVRDWNLVPLFFSAGRNSGLGVSGVSHTPNPFKFGHIEPSSIK
ncbi:hypothetical protein L6452_22018 [Arctium lappa]|uniref:Uncharacterized protein n=1 Tax=Arctium lappa TaxID=4217 RepID=A0ACB9AY21_ARCLA|nr:hypothetical protein L6452_22018 [Arctium lappa]